MNVTVSIHEIISWLLAVAVFTLYLIERRKNSTTPFYMALQGILRACREKSEHLSVLSNTIEEDKREEIPKSEILLYLDIAQTEYYAMMQQIAGTMKAILPFESVSYDIDEFVNSNNPKNFEMPDK